MISSLVLRAEWFSSEILALASKHAGHAIDREIACLDIGGIGVSALYIWLPLLRAYNTCATSHFPERTIHVLILNAGTTFSALWRVVKSIVDPRTAAKMRTLPKHLKSNIPMRAQPAHSIGRHLLRRRAAAGGVARIL